MKATSDAIVVGAGPCGSFAALNMAKHGANVVVLEEHEEVGVPSHCAGHLSIKGLKSLGLHQLSAEIVENSFCGATFYSPKGRSFSIRFSQPVTCVVNRVLFDKYIAKMAEDNGVEYRLNSRVESLIIENGFAKGAIAKQNGRSYQKFLSKIVVDGEGISSRILRQTGLTGLNRHMLVNGVETELENVKDVEMDTVEVFLGKSYAPNFYAWLIPKGDDRAKLGLAAKTGNPKELLLKLMVKHPIASKKLRTAKILQTNFHALTLGGPIKRAYSNGFLAVGDAASQVKPTTGGGVIFGMTSARIAAEVAYEALKRNDFSAEFLSLYQRRFAEILGFDMNVMLRIRKILNAVSDEKLERIISLCSRMELNKTLTNFEDLDFQGKALINALRYPRVLATAILFSFFCAAEILKS
jgi:geranylgeranyl reductase family protein